MTFIQNRYRIIGELGEGGFGRTYLTVDDGLPSKPTCVVKQLKPQFTATSETVRRFQQEARVLEKLGNEHDRIPKLLRYFEVEEQFYLVQEYIPGKTLKQLIEEGRTQDEGYAKFILLEILPVLEYLHGQKIIHRDIAPDNIIIREKDEKPVLIDFGLVKELMVSEAYSMTTEGVGKRGYMAFEQINGQPVYASDIYSLGMTAIALLTGGKRLKRDYRTGEIQWKDLISCPISEDFGSILSKATQDQVKDRYIRASEMLVALTGASEAAPIIEVVESLPKTITNAFGMEFVLIRPGKFWIGSTDEEVREAFENSKKHFSDTKLEWNTREQPRHEVEITKPFWLGKYQMTQKQWRAAATGLRKVDLEMEAEPSHFKGDDLPVEQVSWNDCEEMIHRLNASGEGFVYDFPTEAEWEYACRAGTTTPYWFGGTITPDEVNYNGKFPFGKTLPGLNRGETNPVGSLKKSNGWGLHDMHGNVWEWCRDWFWEDYYQNGPVQDPEGPKQGEGKVLRGGSWYFYAVFCRSACRSRHEPNYRNDDIGFRCVIRSART